MTTREKSKVKTKFLDFLITNFPDADTAINSVTDRADGFNYGDRPTKAHIN